MIFGANLPRASAFTAFALCCMLLACGANASEDDAALAQLMARMKEVRTSSATFVEQKFLAILNAPVESSGTLSYVAPDHIERNTLVPARTRMAVDGDQVTVEDADGKVRTLSLEQSPEIAAIVESIRGTLSGDLDTLRRHYIVTLDNANGDWTLDLKPKKNRLKAVIKGVRIAGNGASVRTVETEEKNGDRTVMTITEDIR